MRYSVLLTTLVSMTTASTCKRTCDLVRELFFLVGSVLFVIGAVGFVRDSTNKYSNPVYVACAINYFMGSAIGIVIYTKEMCATST